MSEFDKTIIGQKSKEEEQKKYTNNLIATETDELKYFYSAEKYHQNYLKKNPNGYCHIKL